MHLICDKDSNTTPERLKSEYIIMGKNHLLEWLIKFSDESFQSGVGMAWK